MSVLSAKQGKWVCEELLFYGGAGKTFPVTPDISDSPEGSEGVSPMVVWWQGVQGRGSSKWEGQRPERAAVCSTARGCCA